MKDLKTREIIEVMYLRNLRSCEGYVYKIQAIFSKLLMFRTQLSCMISHVLKQFLILNHSKLSGTRSLPTNGDGIEIG